MKKRFLTIIIILMILSGLSLLLYPTVSDYLKNMAYRRTIYEYTASVELLNDESYEELLTAARAYNERLAERMAERKVLRGLSEEEQEEYYSLLNTGSTDVMAYVSIPKLNIYLPIYHGTSDGVLQNGVGHLEVSSFPVGGPSTHAALSAHTGLPSAKLFTSIDQLVEGDTFTVRVLREVLTYEVDQILVVLPYEADALRIEPGEDYCTLLTCTPYGINSHRLLVRGHRIPTPVEEERSPDIADEILGPEDGGLFVLAVGVGLSVIAILSLVIFLWRWRMWKRAKRLNKKEKKENQTREPVSGDSASKEPANGDSASEEPADGDSISEEPVSEDSASEEPQSQDPPEP